MLCKSLPRQCCGFFPATSVLSCDDGKSCVCHSTCIYYSSTIILVHLQYKPHRLRVSFQPSGHHVGLLSDKRWHLAPVSPAYTSAELLSFSFALPSAPFQSALECSFFALNPSCRRSFLSISRNTDRVSILWALQCLCLTSAVIGGSENRID